MAPTVAFFSSLPHQTCQRSLSHNVRVLKEKVLVRAYVCVCVCRFRFTFSIRSRFRSRARSIFRSKFRSNRTFFFSGHCNSSDKLGVMSNANSRKTPAAEILQWEVGTNFRITGPNGSWHPAKTRGWQPQFYSGWPDDWPRSEKVTRDMVDVDLDSIFIVKEIRRCGEFVTVEVQEWNYGGVHLKTNIQKGQETWAERVEHDPEPQAS